MGLFEIPDGNRIQEGGMSGFIINGSKILLAKYKGKYYAIDAKCPHQGGDLSQGTLEGKYVVCPRHRRKTDITNGNHLGGLPFPGQRSKKVKSYRVIVEGDGVKVDL